MANVSYNAVVSASGGAGNFDASVMWSTNATFTGNFNAVTDQVNGNLNSINYSVSGFQSSNIAKNAILSQHISNNAVLSAKIGDAAVVNTHMNYLSSDNGARVVQAGKAGLNVCRVSKTFAIAAADSGSSNITFIWTNAIDGNPGFTATPVPLSVPIAQGPSIGTPYRWWKITSINSVSAVMEFHWPSASFTRTDTFEFQVAGF